jgi:3-isopropylmalate/(R)-2-methylmalate dehydratase small subunit
MNNIIRGKVYKCPDDVDTDRIIPAKYLNITDEKELARHCLEGLDKDFYQKSQAAGGIIIVAGKNFGCGSSREHAVIALKSAGVVCILAKSFARIFFRNAINQGLIVIEFTKVDELPEDDVLQIDITKGLIKSEKLDKEFKIKPYPEFLQNLINLGGILKTLSSK